jgi:PRTRC genetic system protein B
MTQSSDGSLALATNEHVFPRRIPDEQAALIFVGEQYLFRYRDKQTGGVNVKFISPSSVAAAFAQIRVDSGWLPSNLLRWGIGAGGEWVVSFVPPGLSELAFENDGSFGAGSDTPSKVSDSIVLNVPLPGLVFLGYGVRYFIWAVTQKPGSTIQTYHAPLPNVDHQGQICFGSNRVPPASTSTLSATWQLFRSAPFSSHLANGKSRRFPEDVRVKLFELARRHRRRYPVRDLLPMNRTLEQVIDSTLRSS